MNESLVHLYELQKVDSQIDELIENRGDLPEQVEQMRRNYVDEQQALEDLRGQIGELESRSKNAASENEELREKIEKYKAQQFDVKTTREYDAITFQLEDAQKRLNRNLEDVGRGGVELENLRNEIQHLEDRLAETKTMLEESETQLQEVMKETEQEEKELRIKRDELEKLVPKQYLTMYNRVRPAKNGVAVVPVRSGVCGGCFNAIPRQLVLELKRGDKHAVCEYCGRIVIGEPIAQAVDGIPEPVDHSSTEGDEEV